jgi:starch synthase (maltosyl-transferring)
MKGRIVIDDIHPCTPSGQFPAKGSVNEHVPVSATIFKDGHDRLAARVKWRPAGVRTWQTASLEQGVNDEWTSEIVPGSAGAHDFVIEAWVDTYSTWRHKLEVKLQASQDVSVELQEGIAFFTQRAAEATVKSNRDALTHVADMLADESLDHQSRAASAMTDVVAALVGGPGKTEHITVSSTQKLWVDRQRALFGAWYELFPRSYGGFKGVIEHLPYVSNMQFDVLYLPPIHPIGTAFRKGKNNTLDPAHDDVGSPWAIGNSEGGHTAIHPDLGTMDDFDALVAAAAEHGLEIALDYALQCSPDHPWVKEHPEWFNHRPDGSIAYAENPPKKYQDIYPINFWPAEESDRVALWEACKGIFDFWIDHGIRIFRVDNPHTKPTAFWAWCIAAVQKEHPDVLFLAEAFTRPKVMAKLAEVGFSQSYTYYTWRTQKWDITEYLVEIALGAKADYMRPNFWPNTPDILAEPLRDAPMGVFKSRLLLAGTLTPSYGVYSGFELGENEPASPANEEYLNSEKYEIRHRDFGASTSIAPLMRQLNEIRRNHPALQQLRNIRFHGSDNEQILCFSKHDATRSDVVLVVVNLDPTHAQECTLSLNLEELGLGWNEPFEVFDELTQRPFYWWGAHNYVRLSPDEPAHILSVRTGSS